MQPVTPTNGRHQVYEYDVAEGAQTFHVAYGYVPGHKLDFLFRPRIPKGASRHGMHRYYYNRIQPLIRYLEPAPHAAFAVSLGNVSYKDAPSGRGALAIILSVRFPDLLDQAGRGAAAFSQGMILPDLPWTTEVLLATLMNFKARFQQISIPWYVSYHKTPVGDRSASIERYIASFQEISLPTRVTQVPSWRQQDPRAERRVSVICPRGAAPDSLLACAARIATLLFNSDLPWSAVHTGGQSDLHDTTGPRGLTVRFVPDDALVLGANEILLPLAEVDAADEALLAARLGLLPGPTLSFVDAAPEPIPIESLSEGYSMPFSRLTLSELIAPPERAPAPPTPPSPLALMDVTSDLGPPLAPELPAPRAPSLAEGEATSVIELRPQREEEKTQISTSLPSSEPAANPPPPPRATDEVQAPQGPASAPQGRRGQIVGLILSGALILLVLPLQPRQVALTTPNISSVRTAAPPQRALKEIAAPRHQPPDLALRDPFQPLEEPPPRRMLRPIRDGAATRQRPVLKSPSRPTQIRRRISIEDPPPPPEMTSRPEPLALEDNPPPPPEVWVDPKHRSILEGQPTACEQLSTRDLEAINRFRDFYYDKKNHLFALTNERYRSEYNKVKPLIDSYIDHCLKDNGNLNSQGASIDLKR